jgi:hypothetical protein
VNRSVKNELVCRKVCEGWCDNIVRIVGEGECVKVRIRVSVRVGV